MYSYIYAKLHNNMKKQISSIMYVYSSRFAHQGTIIISPAFAPFYNYIVYWYMSHSKLTLTKEPNLVCLTNFPDQVGCVAKTDESEPTLTIMYMYVHVEDCEGWWLSGCCGLVAEHWWLKPESVLGSTPSNCRPFYFPLFLPHNYHLSSFIACSLMSGHG